MSSTSNIPAPTDAELLVHLKEAYEKDSSLGAEKVLKHILAENPQWIGKVGLKRVKQIRSENGLICTAPGAPGSSTYVAPPTYEYETVQDTLLTDLLAFRRSVASGQPLSNSQLRRAQELLERANAVDEIDASVVDGHSSKTSGPSGNVKRQLDSRASAAPEAFQEQNRLHVEAQKKGKPHGAGIYAVLQEGDEEYVEERVVWVDTVAAAVTDEQGQITEEAKQAAVVMLERGKAEALLGNPAGVYLIYKSLWSALQELAVVKKGQVRVSERSLAKQLKNEYGIDVLPFKTEAEKDPMGPAGQRLIALLTSMTY